MEFVEEMGVEGRVVGGSGKVVGREGLVGA